jgi:hypothetical protein
MEAQIRQERIDLLGVNLPKGAWEPLLDDLRVVHVRGLNPIGKRITVAASPKGRIDAFIYRTTPMPDAEVARILKKHGISATIVAAAQPTEPGDIYHLCRSLNH